MGDSEGILTRANDETTLLQLCVTLQRFLVVLISNATDAPEGGNQTRRLSQEILNLSNLAIHNFCFFITLINIRVNGCSPQTIAYRVISAFHHSHFTLDMKKRNVLYISFRGKQLCSRKNIPFVIYKEYCTTSRQTGETLLIIYKSI